MMRSKRIIAMVLIMMMVMLLSSTALAVGAGSFTHPEVGEFMSVHIGEGLADFQIYGFTYYRIIPGDKPYRGLNVNAQELINKSNATFEQSMDMLYDSVEGKMADSAPILSFEYTGNAKQYSDQLNDLDRKDRILALRLLNGMDGKKGFSKLKTLPGFESVDVSLLESEHNEYKIRLNGKEYDYRVLMFFFEEEDWYEYYNERYHYIKVNGTWKLIRITKEYSDEYSQRSKYIHGMEGMDPALGAETNAEVLRGTHLGMSADEVGKIIGREINENEITLENEQIFRVPAAVTFHFDKNNLDEVTYNFNSDQVYYSAFISLYIRYFDPVLIDENGDITWYQNDMDITLKYNEGLPILTFSSVR